MSLITKGPSDSVASVNVPRSELTGERSCKADADLKLYSQVSPSAVALLLWRILGLAIFAIGLVITAILPGKTREVLELIGIVIPHPINHHVVFAFIKGVIGFLILLTGTSLILRAKMLAQARETEVIRELPDSFVLYLRSFGADDRMSAPIASGKYMFPVTYEEQLVFAVQGIGPLLAIGRPGEKLPKVGALRLYVDEDNWQNTVRTLMSQARLIVFVAGFSNGFWWELEHAIRKLNPEKFIVLIPFNKKAYAAFCSEAAERLTLDLPETKNFPWLEGNIRAVVYFDASAKPHLYNSRTFRSRDFFRLGHLSTTRGAASYLRILLQPVYENLGIDWHPLRTPWGSLSLLVFGFAALTVGIVTLIQEWKSEPAIHDIARNKIHNILITSPTVEKELVNMTKSEQAAYITKLVQSGLWRLETPLLVQRAALFEKLLYAANTNVCARMTLGNARDEEVLNVLQELSEKEQSIYWDIIVNALQTGLSVERDRLLVKESVDAAFDAVFTNMDPGDADRLSNAIVARQDANPTDVCWAGRTLYRRVNNMAEPHKSVLVRALVAP